jgi:hypothetical protein
MLDLQETALGPDLAEGDIAAIRDMDWYNSLDCCYVLESMSMERMDSLRKIVPHQVADNLSKTVQIVNTFNAVTTFHIGNDYVKLKERLYNCHILAPKDPKYFGKNLWIPARYLVKCND